MIYNYREMLISYLGKKINKKKCLFLVKKCINVLLFDIYKRFLFCFVENMVYEVKEYIKENLFLFIKVLDFVVNILE